MSPARDDLTVAGARKVTYDGMASFEGLAPGAMRCIVEANGYGQRVAPEIEVPEDGEEATVTVRLVDLSKHVGVLRVDGRDPITGPFQGNLHWSVAMAGFSDRGTVVCREDGLTLYMMPGEDITVHCSTGERGGLAGEVTKARTKIGTPTQTRIRLMPPASKR